MKALYRVLAFLVAAGVFVEAASIAYAFSGPRGEGPNGGGAVHETVGMMVMPVVALVLVVVAFFARIPKGVTLAVVVFGLVVLQVLLAFGTDSSAWVGALHGANALAVVGAAISAAIRAGRDMRLPRGTAEYRPTPA